MKGEKIMKYIEPELEIVELDEGVFTELTSVESDENEANTPPSIGDMLD